MSVPSLRIALVCNKFGHKYGGAEAYSVELAHALQQRHDLTVIAYEFDPGCVRTGLHTIPVHVPHFLPSWVRSFMFAQQAAALTREGYDVVISNMNGWCGDIDILHVRSVRYRHLVQATSWMKRLGKRLSVRVQMYLWLEKQRVHIDNPKKITVAVSLMLRQQLQQAYHTPYDFKVIPPGVRHYKANPAQRVAVRQRLGVLANDTLCIQVAKVPLNKGLRTILQALSYLPANVKLIVVGAPSELLTQITPEFELYQLQGRVILQAECADPSEFYQAADICVHPTLNDSFGMAPLEAMAHGLPVILSAAQWCGFAHYVTADQEALILANPTDAKLLAQAITRIQNDVDYRTHLCRNAQALAQKFSWTHIAQEYETLCAQLSQP